MKFPATFFLSLVIAISSTASAQPPCSGRPISSSANWPQFHSDPCHSGYNPYEFLLSPGTVGNLTMAWNYTMDNVMFSSPSVTRGVVYIGGGDA
jgi:hypothetical protein